ncbi:O-methyltransferase [Sulfitobacter sp.]|uniref:O-methyltransferase n=1 Tax=Sulfitobacter sp. TaxID=1903071 RepID=UPI003298D892
MPSNYSVRPNKHVDRELFVDLVGRCLSYEDVGRCAYISMGGPQMADHIAMYRRNGISKLYSFDMDEDVVRRQAFNSPSTQTCCRAHLASDLPGRLDQISEELAADRLVLWLDYTGIGSRGQQLTEFQNTLAALSVGDIARVSLEASFLPDQRKAELPAEIRSNHQAAMAELLRREVGELHPEDVEVETINDIPLYLAKCVERVCDRVSSQPGEPKHFAPLLLTSYSDSSPMFTATILVQNDADQPNAPGSFPFLAQSWNDIENLEVPELSARERAFVDRILGDTPNAIDDHLGFPIARDRQRVRQWESFKKFHRFLPQFHHVEMK